MSRPDAAGHIVWSPQPKRDFFSLLLGTILASTYRGRLDLTGLPASAAHAVRGSASAGVAVAHQIQSVLLLEPVRAAFVHGMDIMLRACGGVAVLGIVLTSAFLPRRTDTVVRTDAEGAELACEVNS